MSEDRELFSDRMLEGEYTTWSWLWTRNIGAFSLDGLGVDNIGTVYAVRTFSSDAYVITQANVVTTFTPYYLYMNKDANTGTWCSATGKYVVGWKIPVPRQIAIFRYGINIANVPYQTFLPDAASPYYIAVSPNGRYIAIIFHSTATGFRRYVVLLEGV